MKEKETEEIEVVEKKTLILKRKIFKGNDAKEYFAYYIDKEMKSIDRTMVANLKPKDNGGYELLDLIFRINPKPELLVETLVMKDDLGKRQNYLRYSVKEKLEDGILEVVLKPQRDSDSAILKLISGGE